MRPNWVCLLQVLTSTLVIGGGLAGCATTATQPAKYVTPPIVLDFDTTNMSEDKKYWLQQINQFFIADVKSVIEPYNQQLERLNSWPEEDFCSNQHQRAIEDTLALNNTSLMAYRMALHCAESAANDELGMQIRSKIDLISTLLLQSGNGKTPQQAITIRELYEAQIIFNWVGISVFDMEMVRLGNQVVFKVHAMDSITSKYSVYYVENTEFFARQQNLLIPQNGKSKQLAKIQMENRFQTGSIAAFLWQFNTWLKNDHPELVIQSLENAENLGAVASVALAYAYLHQQNNNEFEFRMDDLLTYSENGFINASAALGQYMLSTQDPFEAEEAAHLYQYNVKTLGAEEATNTWLEGFLNQPNNSSAFDLLLANLSEEYYSYWRTAINNYNTTFGLITPLVNQKLSYLLQRLGEKYPRAKLDYAHILLNGSWNNQQDSEAGLAIIEELAQQGYAKAQLDYGILYTFSHFGISKDRKKAVYWYQQAAQQGEPNALYNLALAYRFGRGVKRDLSQAVEYFQQSLDAGFQLAGCRLGDLYGDEVEKRNYDLAVKFYEQVIDDPQSSAKEIASCAYGLAFIEIDHHKNVPLGIQRFKQAAQLGDKDALFELGVIYRAGELVEKNIKQSIAYYVQAVNKGSFRAAANLGYIYEHGEGVPVDLERAVNFYQFSARGGNPTGQNNYATALRYGNGVEKDLESAISWYQKAASQGNGFAAENLADIYYLGEHGESDYKLACDYYEKAVEFDLQSALYDVGYCYFYGEGREQNIDVGLKYLEQSAATNNQSALVELGYIYASGELVEVNPQKSESYYIIAYGMQNSAAAFGLGQLHETDNGLKKDPVLSTVFYEQSAKWGSVEGMLATAKAYMQGVGTKSDPKKAKSWLEKAVEKGSEEAKMMLKNLR
ncbi:MAG: SEL1-like repeat protein [Aliiglaciecola sp.]|uniref:SEL1-like repeat protein n=1 Tax=Aliiglaciecola sp. TaxID=1872441 RepID=UPI0032986D54